MNNWLPWALAAITTILFIISLVRFSKRITHPKSAAIGKPLPIGVAALDDVNSQYFHESEVASAAAEDNRRLQFWLSFTVTALTAASALVSSLQAGKIFPKDSVTPIIITAILTFCSTIVNFIASHLASLQPGLTRTATDILNKLANLKPDYERANTTEKADILVKALDDLRELKNPKHLK